MNITVNNVCLMAVGLVLIIVSNNAFSQAQIPTLQVCNKLEAGGGGTVFNGGRTLGGFAGTHGIKFSVRCDPSNPGYPSGTVSLRNINMSDSDVSTSIQSTSLEQVTITGKHTPMLFINGRCKVELATHVDPHFNGCRFWLMVADNRSALTHSNTPDIVSFLVFNGQGQRIAYGTGELISGDISVSGTSD